MDSTTGVTINTSGYVNTNFGVGGLTTLSGALSATSGAFSSTLTQGGSTVLTSSNYSTYITGGSGGLPTTGGTISGNLAVSGTTTCSSSLNVTASTPTFNMIGTSGTGAGAQCIMNLSPYIYSLNPSPCSVVITDDGSYGCSFAINQKTKGAIANSQFTSFLLDDVGTCTLTNNLKVTGTNSQLLMSGSNPYIGIGMTPQWPIDITNSSGGNCGIRVQTNSNNYTTFQLQAGNTYPSTIGHFKISVSPTGQVTIFGNDINSGGANMIFLTGPSTQCVQMNETELQLVHTLGVDQLSQQQVTQV
jgi:hypothetical protein